MLMNLIAQLTAAAPSQPATTPDMSAVSSDRFAALLNDAGARGGNEQKQPGLKQSELSIAALSAQEVQPETVSMVLTAVSADARLLSLAITPDDAKAMLPKLEAMNEQGQYSEDPAFQQLKEALEQIEVSGETTDVASVLEVLPEVTEALPEDRAPVLQRLMGWVSAAIDKHKEAPASAMPDGTVQSLQASLFPTGDDAPVAATQAAPQVADEDKKSRVTEAPALVAVMVPTAQSLVMPEWVRKMGEGEEQVAAVAINEAIPPLALEDGEEGLPVVDLPDAADFTPATKDGEKVTKDFAAVLSAVPVSAREPVEQIAAPLEEVEATTVTALSNAPSVHNTSTLNPITISAHKHLATHTAAAEQVQVAITTMKDEELNSITLQLEPADLGRVEIKMDTVEGKTSIAFLIDKPETLDSLARDARSLERMLQDAGVRADAGSMQFNLRQQAQEQAADDDDRLVGNVNAATDDALDEISALPGTTTNHYTLNVNDGVDIHA